MIINWPLTLALFLRMFLVPAILVTVFFGVVAEDGPLSLGAGSIISGLIAAVLIWYAGKALEKWALGGGRS